MAIVYGFGNRSALASQTIVQMRTQLDLLQRQLATGKVADTYGGLGVERGLDLELRARLSRVNTYETAIFTVDLRVKLMNTALERLRAIGTETRSETRFPVSYELISGGQTAAQRASVLRLDEALSLLNEKAGERYLFSGRAADKPATDTVAHILNGDGGAAGLRQLIAERLLADRGADGRGRLLTPTVTGDTVTIAEDGAHPFGFKLASVTTDFGATITGPAGDPASVDIELGVNPPANSRVTIRLTLPDGGSYDVELTATTENPPPERAFLIGASADDTAQNLAAAIDQTILSLGQTELAAASAMQAGEEFFAFDADNPPRRVDGPPFETATALRDATATDTVRWYVGDAATDDPRRTALARVDDAVTVAYGARANEEGLRRVVQNVAVFAAMTFSESDPNGRERYFALVQRIGKSLDHPEGVQHIKGIQTDIAGANLAAGAAKQRIADKKPVLLGLIDEIENVSPEEVGVKLLTLNTRMQATLQTTALLSRFTLLDYI